ncbi:methylated-DNA--[protein]-cysteine S-methyltransferase [Aquamicrobium sp. LC103]|uniref:methylated-DNA--[protein]-cysteine S-methyltransferase n=1 Tax=Aquamicrobium sp. LC103 TaxID=1120658 RepID=UPI00063E961F|nr:methylated-DNA--[protein]-cysteine S-methyltransferase [Aquamicrobium sp. LC103]TKT80369.1 methylated-DNA--[protein]-cysteine S-methyltransferase [Aquamicrobium sp. LC103]
MAECDRTGHHILETPLGFIGIRWSGDGLTRLALPGRSRESVARRVAGDTEETALEDAPAFVAGTLDLLARYCRGEQVDFSAVPVDIPGLDPFRRAIYAAARRLAYGEVTTYGELADSAGFPKMARETGQALGQNPVPIVVPCHRIVAAGGKIGGFSAPGGSATKERLLLMEGVHVGPPPSAQAAFDF